MDEDLTFREAAFNLAAMPILFGVAIGYGIVIRIANGLRRRLR
jgi:hypothetical protein